MTRCQRRIIDLAYRIDQEFAATLASIADTDPAKSRRRSEELKRGASLF